MTQSLPTPGASASDTGPVLEPVDVDITDPSSAWDRLLEAVGELGGAFVDQLPLIVLGVVVFVVGLGVVRLAQRLVDRATGGGRFDVAVARLIQTLSRVVLVTIVLLLALDVAGFNVGSALAALGIAGLAIAFAVQSILENFIAGLLLLIRRPFRPGDQVKLGDFEGTVEDVNLRVTRIVDYDGEVVLLPNSTVFAEAITNRTKRGRRRTTVMVGVDYRDDHDAAREVLRDAVAAVGGVLPEPQVLVQLTEFGDSSVDFAVRYWTLPEQAEVLRVQDLVLAAAKSGLEDAGMTIPWPIRTLVVDEDSKPALRATGRRAGSGTATDGQG